MKTLLSIVLLIATTSAFAYTDYTKQTQQQSCNTYCTEIAGSNTCNTVCTQ